MFLLTDMEKGNAGGNRSLPWECGSLNDHEVMELSSRQMDEQIWSSGKRYGPKI